MATATGRDALPHAIRHRFPLLEHQVYLNSCSQGVLSDAVRDAYADYLRDWDEKGAPWEYWMERTESARASFAGLVGADNDEVAVTASVSAGVNAIASGLPRRRAATASSSPTSSSRPSGRSGTPRRTAATRSATCRRATPPSYRSRPSTPRSTSGPRSSRSRRCATATARASTSRA